MVCFPFIKLNYGKQLSFSKEPGYYDTPFYLSILGGKGGTIHYTLDGSEPTVDDPVFDRKNPLYIEDATNHPNVYSMRTDTSTGFCTDLIAEYSTSVPNYAVPTYPVDKCTVLRASLFDSSGNRLSSVIGTYFVGFREKKGYQDIYTASIVTSPENLFDDDIGIYITGNTFKKFLETDINREDYLDRAYWWWWPSNYSSKGIDWERASHITLFDSHRNMILSQECGIRIKGGGSRGQLPRSISSYAREIYDGNNRFNANIFQTEIFPHKIVLFAGGDDNRFKLKDYLVNTMTQDLHFATLDFLPCVTFLNGEYWGVYFLSEDYNIDYIHDHYQVDQDNIIMVKNSVLTEGRNKDQQTYENMLDYINEQDMSVSANYNQACDLIDINSYIDYHAAQIYINRCNDWPSGNFALWRARDNDGSCYGDEKWRWMLFDVNSDSLNDLSADTLSYVLSKDYTFASLYQNEEFRRKFAERLLYIGSETFAPEKCNQFIDQYVQTMKDPLAASNMRFYMDDKSEEFEQYVTDMRTFFDGRYDVVWNFLVDNMGEEWLSQNGIKK